MQIVNYASGDLPANGTPGYAAGCVFAAVDGIYRNAGDQNSCNFVPQNAPTPQLITNTSAALAATTSTVRLSATAANAVCTLPPATGSGRLVSFFAETENTFSATLMPNGYNGGGGDVIGANNGPLSMGSASQCFGAILVDAYVGGWNLVSYGQVGTMPS